MSDTRAATPIGGLVEATLDLMFGPARTAVSFVHEQFSLQRDTADPAPDGGAPVEPGETTIPPDSEADEHDSPAPDAEPTYTPTTDEEAASAPGEADDASEESGRLQQEVSAETDAPAEQEATTDLEDVWGVGPSRREELAELGYTTVGELAEAEVERLMELQGVGEQTASRIVESARELLG